MAGAARCSARPAEGVVAQEDGIIIRQLLASDSLIELTDLLHRAYARLADMGLRYRATHQSVEVTRERVEQGTCFLAVAGSVLVGTVVFKDMAQTGGCAWYDQPDVASLTQFAVEPGLQGEGLGRRLILMAEDAALASGSAEIALDTAEPAHHLVDWYGRLGYRPIEYVQWGHTNYRTVIMSKTLTK